MVESLWEDKTKAWLGWRAGKGGVWGGFSWKNGAVQFSTESTALTILLSLGGHQENQIGIEKQDKRSRKNPEQPVGKTVPTEKILKLEPKMVTKKNYKMGTEYTFCLRILCTMSNVPVILMCKPSSA